MTSEAASAVCVIDVCILKCSAMGNSCCVTIAVWWLFGATIYRWIYCGAAVGCRVVVTSVLNVIFLRLYRVIITEFCTKLFRFTSGLRL